MLGAPGGLPNDAPAPVSGQRASVVWKYDGGEGAEPCLSAEQCTIISAASCPYGGCVLMCAA